MILDDLLIVSFDGLNRAGKGTQITLLREHLGSGDHLVEVLRGDGSRPGKNTFNVYDPYSKFWQQWQQKPNKSLEEWTYAAEVLAHENYLRCVELASEASEAGQQGVVLLDRSHLSRWYMKRKENITAPFESCFPEPVVTPDIYFILDVPKDVLLKRNSDDDPAKAEFRRKNVLAGYDLWVSTLNSIPRHIPIHRLDGSQTKQDIHEEVKQVIGKEIYS